jgi:hypothetical protein
MTHLPAVLAAAEEVQAFCGQQNWAFCFIGGVAVQRWAEPRMTIDVDITLLTGFGNEEPFADGFLAQFAARRQDARQFAIDRRVLLVKAHNGVDVDIAFGGLSFEERTIQRASHWQWARDHSLFTCSAEDLVVHKVFAGRGLDWTDAERVLKRQHGKLNLEQIRTELKPLLEMKEAFDSLKQFDELVKKVDHQIATDPNKLT